MQELIYTAFVPHPPLIVPAVGGAEWPLARATHTAMQAVGVELSALAPDTVVVISPHGPVFSDAIAIHQIPEITGDLGAFGAPEVALRFAIDTELARLIETAAHELGVPVAPVTADWAAEWNAERLDHGTLVPLHFVAEAGWEGPIVPIAIGYLPALQLYIFGQALQRAIDRSGQRVAVLASGDLSHRLTAEAPAGYSPEGQRFDDEVMAALHDGDLARLFDLDPAGCEAAGSCGLRPLMMLAGVLDGLEIKPQVRSYEGPLGVGYAVVPLLPGRPAPHRQLRPQLERERRLRAERRRAAEHPVAAMARAALEHYVRTGLELDFSAGAPHEGTVAWQLPPGLPDRAAAFVSLKIDGELRGCMGSVAPEEPALALEIVRKAIMAGRDDPRFPPVEEAELTDLEYTVDLLSPPEPCQVADLDPQEYGIQVSHGEQHGLLLPGLPGITSAAEQFAVACRKAGLDPSAEGIQIQRFRVRRFK